ncbi:MAG: protein-disulfide reductase DsbD domain-containing protein [Pseudomonadota bacterium]
MKPAALFSVLALLPMPLVAQPTGLNGDVIEVEVLQGWREPGMEHIAGLRLTLAAGWKTYWRAPGDAGIPPMFDWTGSENVARVHPHWPVPEIFNQNGMRSIGYDQEVVIPLHVTRLRSDEPIRLQAEVSLGVCEEICIPAFVSIDAVLPSQGAADADIIAALGDRPLTEAEARVGDVVCSVAPIDDGLSLTVTVSMPPLGRGEAAAIETADPTVWVAEPELSRDGNTLTATTELVRYDAAPFVLDRSGVRTTVFGGNAAVDIRGCSAG